MKKYSQVIPQKINESAVLGKEVYSDMEDDNFLGFVATMALMFPELNAVIDGWDDLLSQSSGKGAQLFKKENHFFLRVSGFGLFEMSINLNTTEE